MPRTESKTFQCHPNDAQQEIDLYQQFHWSLLSNQDVKTVDNSLEKRGDSLYNVRKSEHYVKLTFSRDLDTPNLNEIKKLEAAYHAIRKPVRRKEPERPEYIQKCAMVILFCGIILSGIGLLLFGGIGLTAFGAAFVLCYCLKFVEDGVMATHRKECERIDQEYKQNLQKYTDECKQILSEVKKYN